MRIVQSHWSKPSIEKFQDPRLCTSGWPEARYHWYCCALSVLIAKNSYGNVHLTTDTEGAKILVEQMGLPYDSVSTSLDGLNVHHGLWAYGKILTYLEQNEPFLHIDFDVLLWRKLPDRFNNRKIIVQHLESNPAPHDEGDKRRNWYYYTYDQVWETLNAHIKMPPCMKHVADCGAYNMGVFGGNDLDTIKSYASMVQEIVTSPDNKAGWEALSSRGNRFVARTNCTIEQLSLYCFLKDVNVWPYPLFFKGENSDKGAEALGYTHLVGGKSMEPRYRDAVHHRLLKMAPEIVERVDRMLDGIA